MDDLSIRDARPDQRRGETVDYAVDRLRDGIMVGRFAPGQRLIARDLTEQFGISRGSVREAFRRLAAIGLVELVPNRGATVRRLTQRQVRELFQIRENLEGLAARLAAQHIDDAGNRAQFEEVWERVRPTNEPLPWNVFIANNRLYHHTIVSIGGNRQLCDLIDNLQLPVMMVQIGRAMRTDHADKSHADHVAVAEAITAADPDAAEAAMRRHLRRSAGWVLAELPAATFSDER